MRIIAGKYRSRIIKMPKGAGIRPTKDRIREALFAIIGDFVVGSRVLDAFAGSGAFGIEALSRGAESAVFVEKDPRCVKAIKENLEALKIEGPGASILRMDAQKALDVLEHSKERFNIVLADPPYHKDAAKIFLINVDGRDILPYPCLIVVEHHKGDELPASLKNITSFRQARYGDICLTFYKGKR